MKTVDHPCILRTGAVLAAISLAPAALAGDAPAHREAAARAAQKVAAMAEFKHGVGGPPDGCPGGSQSGIPFSIPEYPGGNEAVNDPDGWLCDDGRQPPVLTARNLEALAATDLSDRLLFSQVIPGCPMAMVCNYNHFAKNPAGKVIPTAEEAFAITMDWANLVLAGIPKGAFACDQESWRIYWDRVLNALHYEQDRICEHHAIGNSACNGRDLAPPLQAVGEPYTFAGELDCYNFNTTTVAQAMGPAPTLHCDADLLANIKADGVYALCVLGSPIACMGYERLLRHHCDVTKKSLVCAGTAPTSDCTVPNSYCEGEICDRGGQDFLGDAIDQTVPVMLDAARAWAKACPQTCLPCGEGGWTWTAAASPGGCASCKGAFPGVTGTLVIDHEVALHGGTVMGAEGIPWTFDPKTCTASFSQCGVPNTINFAKGTFDCAVHCPNACETCAVACTVTAQ